MKRTLICIPTYNEAENVEALISRIFDLYPSLHVLVVDDSSPDGTSEIVMRLQHRFATLHLITREEKSGLGGAYCRAFQFALEHGYDWAIQMDADFSHDPIFLGAMLPLQDRVDFIVGSRYIPGGGVRDWPLHRQLLSKFGNLYAKFWLGSPLADLTGGFNMWSTKALEQIDFNAVTCAGYAFQVEMKHRANLLELRGLEIPIIFRDRQLAKSKMGFAIMLEAFYRIPALSLSALLVSKSRRSNRSHSVSSSRVAATALVARKTAPIVANPATSD